MKQSNGERTPLPVSRTGMRWVVGFKDDLGTKREFEFSNFGYTHDGEQSNFGYAVMEYAMELCKEQIITDVLLQHFQSDQIGLDRTNATTTSVALLQERPSKADIDFAKFVDKKKGVN